MNESATVAALFRSGWQDLLRGRRPLFVFEALFKLAEAWLLIPFVVWLLAVVLAQAGHTAVSNLDILTFLLTPFGLVYAALFGTVAVAALLLELAGIMVVADVAAAEDHPPIAQRLRKTAWQAFRVGQLGALMLAQLAAAMIPFVLLAALTANRFLSQHDIYYYLKERPPAFWMAAGIGALLLLGALAMGMWLYVRWALALPILLFENQVGFAALRASRARVRGAAWRVGGILIGWHAGLLLIGMALGVGFRFAAQNVLDHAGARPIVVIVLLLLVQGSLLATWSFVAMVGQGLLTRRLYLLRNRQLGLAVDSGAVDAEKPAAPWNWRLALLTLPLFLLAPLALWVDLSRYVTDRPPVAVTAHRGHSRAAPENTLSAIRKAIASNADFAEIDVQLTGDGVIVLLHDSDLQRVAGVPRRIDAVKFDEVRDLDVGSWFDPAFADERIPTLAEAIDLARGRIKLNVELKFYGPDRSLAQAVADLLRAQNFEADSIVTALNYDALEEVKRHNPKLRTGLIVAHAIGDISRLDLDILSVRADHLSPAMLRAAHERGQEVHVWTVNDAGQMTRMIKRGVDNLITSDPDLAVRVRGEWADLTGPERLLLSARLLLGLEPE